MFPQFPSQLSTIDSPVARLHLLNRLHWLFYEQTQTEQIPFVFNGEATSQEAEFEHEWASPAALADRAEFARWAEEDEIVVPPRGYTPPPTVGVIGSKPTRPSTPEVNSKTKLDAQRQNLLELLLYGPSAAASVATSTSSHTRSSNPSVATSFLNTPVHNSPGKAKNPPLKGDDNAEIFKKLEDFLDTIVADDVDVV